MMSRISSSAVMACLLPGCAVVGPLVDRDMSDAPFSACTEFAQAAQIEPAKPQCLVQIGSDMALGDRLVLSAGQSISLRNSGAEGCTGDFTHLSVNASSSAPGLARVTVHDVVARGAMTEEFRWKKPIQSRRWVIPEVGSAVRTPSIIDVQVISGELALDRMCLKSYSD